jgi:hypothetical protein
MHRITLGICSILIIVAKIASQTPAPGESIDNYCNVGTCVKCSYNAASKKKSCGMCGFSMKTLVKGQTEVYECTKKDSIKNCLIYLDEADASSGCGKCSRTFVTKKTKDLPKPYFECAVPTTAIVPIANCDETYIE